MLPGHIRLSLLHGLFKLAAALLPAYRKVARKNLEIAFPEKSATEREQVFKASLLELARLLSDIIRIPQIDAEWAKNHVTIENENDYLELHNNKSGKGILIATGHLGSFEILARSAALRGYPLSFVARNFTMPAIDHWWKAQRNQFGNEMIDRKGAYKRVIDCIKSGRNAGLLIDQNVTRNRAVFVDFFGVKAATTKALALAAIQTTPTIVVAGIEYVGDDNYTMLWEEVETHDLYTNNDLTREEITYEITLRASQIYEKMIRRKPESWFWMHRRWKTRPTEEEKNPYKE